MFAISTQTDVTKSAVNIDCLQFVKDMNDYAFAIAPTPAFEQPQLLMNLDTQIVTSELNSKVSQAIASAHLKTVYSQNRHGLVALGRVRRKYANDIDIIYFDDLERVLSSFKDDRVLSDFYA